VAENVTLEFIAEQLRRLHERLGGIDQRLDGIQADTATIRHDLALMRADVDTLTRFSLRLDDRLHRVEIEK
jgi:class 3 adenylate cyclase